MSNKEFLDYEGLGYLAEHVNLQDGKKIVKKLRTGETTLTITDSVITTDSIIDIYSDLYGAYATSVTQSNGLLSITFPVQDRDLNIIVIVRDGRGGGINPTGDAVEGDVLLNKTFSNDDGVDKVGTMPNNGAVSPSALSPNGSYTIPEGYHNGNGVVTASPNTGTYSPTTRNAALDMGIDNLNRYVDTTGVPNSNTETYTASSRGASLDMGATNNYRYVNTNGVPNSNSSTYTFPANDTGGTKDLGETNAYRYVNATNVYNKGKADAITRFDVFAYSTSASSPVKASVRLPYSFVSLFNQFRVTNIPSNGNYRSFSQQDSGSEVTTRDTNWHNLSLTNTNGVVFGFVLNLSAGTSMTVGFELRKN